MHTTSAPRAGTATRRLLRSRTGLVLATMAAAVFVNLAIYTLGAVIGGTYRFTSQGQPATVDALTLIGFTAVPIGVGMAVAALLPARWRWVTAAALTVTIVVGIGSIFAMPLQTSLDAASRIALSLCHVAVTAVTCAGLLALRAVRGRSDQETTATS